MGEGNTLTPQARFRYGSQRSGTKLEDDLSLDDKSPLAKDRRAHSALLVSGYSFPPLHSLLLKFVTRSYHNRKK